MKHRYTLSALADLDAILDYVATKTSQGAERVQVRIQAIIDLLLIHLLIGTRNDDPVIRRMAKSPYLYFVFYEVTGDEIIIHAVRHAARDPSSMPGSA